MAEQIYPKPPRPRKDKSGRRYKVDYNGLVFDDGAASWTSYYRTKWFSRLAAWYRFNIHSYGGNSVIFTDQWKKE